MSIDAFSDSAVAREGTGGSRVEGGTPFIHIGVGETLKMCRLRRKRWRLKIGAWR